MGIFITIEGIEGSGKSTLLKSLAENLKVTGREVVCTREPGATPLGSAIRQLLLSHDGPAIAPLAELLLFSADRAQHVESVLRPALSKGAVVLCDRYVHSTLSYQGFGRGLPLESLRSLMDYVTSGLKPDLVLLLDLEPSIGLARAAGRTGSEEWTRFEEEKLSFHSKVRQGFLELASDSKENMLVLDASQDSSSLANDAWKAVSRKLEHM